MYLLSAFYNLASKNQETRLFHISPN